MTRDFEIAFEGADRAEASRLANVLEAELREVSELSIARKKDRSDSQDFGSTLVLVFGTPAAIVLAKAISNFLQRNTGARIRITKAGDVFANNLDSRDAARIAEVFAGSQSK